MKRIVSLVLAVSMVFGLFATVFAAGSYSDLTGENAKFASAVAALSELKVDDQPVINGYPDGTFGPEKTVTRAELAKMLVVCLGLGSEVEALATKTVFSDVPTTHWAAGWINAAAQSKVIVGYPDGSFGPEKTVTYAEAFTMALRALGYGNVADFEGTWPTAYMLKAVELGLTEDMEGIKADVAATRGNIAILLWNMLRTPMWRVTEESERSGMTLSNRDYSDVSEENRNRMLNIKFPDYTYVEDVYLMAVDVIDNEDVEVWLVDFVDGEIGEPFSAKVKNVDITRLIPGQQVTALVKEGKKNEEDTFLTLSPENEIVEGVVTKVETNDDDEIVKVTVNDTEYKFDSSDVAIRPQEGRIKVNDYVVFEANGKKVNTLRFSPTNGNQARYPVMTTVPYDGAEIVDNVKTAQRAMKEDSLVIRNGEWTDREAIEEGDVVTKLKDSQDQTPYFMVANVREEGAFESYATKKVGDDVTHTFVVDGEEYRNVLGKKLLVKEDDKTITLDDKGAPLNAKAKDNKYIDEDVEVVLDFLGLPAALLFEDIDDLANDGSFYAIVGGYYREPGKGGKDMISLVGFDGEGASADEVSEGVDKPVKKNADLDESLEERAFLKSGDVVFTWAKFDTDDETITALIPFTEDGLTSGEPEEYKSKFVVASLADCMVEDGKVELADGTVVKLPADVPVMTVTPLEDDDEKVEGFAVEITEGVKNKTEFVEGSYVAYDGSKRVPKAAYVFVAEEPESTEVFYGLVEDYDEATQNGVGEVKINGVKYEYDADNSAEEPAKDAMVTFTKKSERGKDKEIVKILSVLEASEIDDADFLIVAEKESEDEIIFSGDDTVLDLTDEDLLEEYEDFKVIEIAVETEDDNKTLKIASVEEVGKGLKAIPNTEGVRVSEPDTTNEVIFIITGLKGDDVVTAGELQDAAENNTDNQTNTPIGD